MHFLLSLTESIVYVLYHVFLGFLEADIKRWDD